ncbi:glycosyl hydrolases family 31-domain-containing protein [Mycena floridula]|nr:glycosyl hydrolases family 31-domain-containing protein [Mycena floridula]
MDHRWSSCKACFILAKPSATRHSSRIEPVSQCISLPSVDKYPGYKLSSIAETSNSLTAKLALAGAKCNAFGTDIENLTIHVEYESQSRLHVQIVDTDNKQFTIPSSVIALGPSSSTTSKGTSDLVFNHVASPFAFWITRRSDPNGVPLFDTRINSLPKTPIPPVIATDNTTALDGFPLVFEDQYLQLTSALPLDANIYGLGEVLASSGIRRNVRGIIQTMWSRDTADPVDENVYGVHPFYVEHRFNQKTQKSSSHGVFLFSSAGADILLLTPPNSDVSLIEYRMLGGVLDFYFFSGPDPLSVVEQYGQLIGLPTWQPVWGFGFQLCRWGYHDINETRLQVEKMREANIPLEVMWNDIDLYHAVRDFTTDPVTFPAEEVRSFIRELAANNQKYIPIVDAAIAHQSNSTDLYNPYLKGAEQQVFITNPNGTEYIGQVWPGYTVFPDWFAKNTQSWWTEALSNWSKSGVEFSGIWLDMNEASSFCDGSCGTGANLSDTSLDFLLPGDPGNAIVDYPECYNSAVSGPSGNLTVNGTLTCMETPSLNTRGLGAGHQSGVELNAPPYTIHNGFGPLSIHALATNATHVGGIVELDVHNMFGMMEEKTTHLALQDVIPGKRPFLISRSTFPSSGKWSGHWLGDNSATWQYLSFSIQGILQFQLFQIPFVGADTCGFMGNTDEELCNRWMQLSAFAPFYRNHNQRGALSQEPYRWDSVANASRTAIATRYSMLPYWYTLFANSSLRGTAPVRPLFFEFPDEPELFGVDQQFMIGREVLVTPVLTPNVTSVNGIFPGRGKVTWRDWYTHDVVNASVDANTTLSAPLGHINVHVRDGAAILLHAEPAYTVEETRAGPFSLLVSLASNGQAFGTTYLDDGVSFPPGPSTVVTVSATKGQLNLTPKGAFHVAQKLQEITLLGISTKPKSVTLQGKAVSNFTFAAAQQKVVIGGLAVDLNSPATLKWT